jgi:hypothetical protein
MRQKMFPPQWPFFFLLVTTTLAVAHPHHTTHTLQKRSSTSKRTIGISFAIAISLLVLIAITFYLGMRRERKGTWSCWRDAASTPNNNTNNKISELEESPEPSRLRSRISCPFALASSAPVELDLSPISPLQTAQAPRYLELPATKEIYEMGMPSPRRPSWLDRQAWWMRFSTRLSYHERARHGSNASARRKLYELDPESAQPPPAYPEAVHLETSYANEKFGATEKARKSGASGLMDWSGMDYVKRIYKQPKNGIGVEGAIWF